MEERNGHLEIEADQVAIGDALGTRPHTRLVLVPVVARLNNRGLDLVLNGAKGLKGVLGWGMRLVKVDLVLGCCKYFRPWSA